MKSFIVAGARAIFRLVLAAALAWALTGSSLAKQSNGQGNDESVPPIQPSVAEIPGAPVEIDGRPVLLIYSPIAGLSPEERAANIEQRILGVAKRHEAPGRIYAEDRGAWTEILSGDEVLMVVLENDAKAAGRQRVQMAAEYAEIVRRTIVTYREEHTWRAVLKGVIKSAIATAALVVSILLLFRMRRTISRKIDKWIAKTADVYPLDSFRSRGARYLLLPLLGTGIIVIMLAVLALLEIYVAFVLHGFPSTRYISIQMNRWAVSEMSGVGRAIWDYLPNLVLVIVIFITARYLVRLNHFVFAEIRDGRLKLHGFYPDWGTPTEKLVRLVILAATAVVVFPYLPGSNSPAFRGISVFLGVLLSLGSTSAVSHGVAGTILTYMRSFGIGDFVRIGDTVGEVVERNLLVTRIRTQKKEIVTIPNGSVLGGVVTNYSVEARKNGIVFYTRVSIGYDAPWRKVHELLINAALSTDNILQSPRPFVLESSLDDFYVSYELNAFTAQPHKRQEIYSELHQNIQDHFNEAGIEINSPHYTSLRDGNHIAVPDNYVPSSYNEPGFRLRQINGSGGPPERREQVASKAPVPRS